MLIYANNRLAGFLAAAISLSVPLTAAGAEAGRESSAMQWVLVGETTHLDPSTRYLKNGLLKAGIRHARKALRRDGSVLNQVIANHNLCIGLIRDGEVDAARVYCQAMIRLPVPPLSLVRVTDNLYKAGNGSGDSAEVSLDAIISANMNRVNGMLDPERLVKLESGSR